MKHIGVILRKELRSYFDSPVAYIFIVIFLLLGGMYFISNFFLQNTSSLKALFEATPVLLLFFAPAITMRLISEEKKSGTFEIIGTKPVKTGEIIFGKFFAAWLLVLFALIPTLLYLVGIGFIGTADLGESFAGYLGLFLLGGAFVAIGLLGSTLSENQIVSFIFSFVIILTLFSIEKILIYIPMKFLTIVEYLSVDHHYSSFSRGIIDTRDIIYFVSLITIALLSATVFAEVETVGTVLKMRVFGWKQQLPRLGLVIIILVFANLLSFKIFARTDMTANKAYTLTGATKNLLLALDDDFVVKAYFSPNLPPPYHNHRQIVQEQFDEYRAYAPGTFHYQFVNPFSDPEIERDALQQGISPVQVKVIKNDKFQTEKVYAGLVFTYADKVDRTPVVQNPQQIEYYIASSIKKMMSEQTRKIAFATGHGERDVSAMNGFKQALKKNFDITTVDLSGDKPVPADVAAVIIVAPQMRFNDKAKFVLDQFIMHGGKAAFFMKNTNVNQQILTTRPVETNLDDLFEAYGWIINRDLVADAHCRSLTVKWDESSTSAPTEVSYPFYPVMSEFNSDILGVKELSPVAFTYVSSVDTRLAAIRDVSANILLTSSTQSKPMKGDTINVDPRQNFNVADFTDKNIPVAAGFEGEFKSWYTKAHPQGSDASGIPNVQIVSQSPNTRIIAVGDGDFVTDEHQRGFDNVSFAATCIDWLFDDVELHAIRTRTTESKPLNDISENAKTTVKYFDFAGPPAIVIFAGIVRFMKRKARRKKRQQTN